MRGGGTFPIHNAACLAPLLQYSLVIAAKSVEL